MLEGVTIVDCGSEIWRMGECVRNQGERRRGRWKRCQDCAAVTLRKHQYFDARYAMQYKKHEHMEKKAYSRCRWTLLFGAAS